MVLVKNWQFFHVFHLGKIDHENVRHDVRERKNAFLGYENKMFKSRKLGVFPKGLVHGFGQKLVIFPSIYLLQKRPRKFVL